MDVPAPDPLTFCEHLPDKCACRWVSYLGITGWYLQQAHRGCLLHKKEDNGEPEAREDHLRDHPADPERRSSGHRP